MAKVVSKRLFSARGGNLLEFIDYRRKDLCLEIANYDPARIIEANANEEELFRKYCLEPPALRDNEEPRMLDPKSTPGYSSIISATIVVSFDGDGDLFDWLPPLDNAIIPHGEISGNEIHIAYKDIKDSEKFKVDYERNLSRIKEFLKVVGKEAEYFNNSLRPLIRESIAKRTESLLGSHNLIESIGLPIKRYDEIPKAYEAPDTTKELEFEKPEKTAESSDVELHRLRGNTYEDILEIIYSMSRIMEKSPRVFYGLKEPFIRDFFLVFLNGHYGWIGHTSGETFNRAGHADIIIDFEGMNIFVAECKFWGGEKKLQKTIDQLFRYVTWRDTKTAILLFSRNKSFSGVLRQIDDIMKSHGCHSGEYQLESANLQKHANLAAPEDGTIFGYKFCLPGDKDRELFLTVMAFDIPNEQEGGDSEQTD